MSAAEGSTFFEQADLDYILERLDGESRVTLSELRAAWDEDRVRRGLPPTSALDFYREIILRSDEPPRSRARSRAKALWDERALWKLAYAREAEGRALQAWRAGPGATEAVAVPSAPAPPPPPPESSPSAIVVPRTHGERVRFLTGWLTKVWQAQPQDQPSLPRAVWRDHWQRELEPLGVRQREVQTIYETHPEMRGERGKRKSRS